MTLNLSRLLLIAAIVCLVVALLLALSVFNGGNATAWFYGGILAALLSKLP